MLRARDFPLVAAAVIAIYFAALTGPGFGMQFAPDDFQNLWRYWHSGPVAAVEANLLLVTNYYRPLGALFYLPLFHMFRFDPLPYRIVYHALIWLNLFLLYRLARHVNRGGLAVGLAVLVGGFHAEAVGVYMSNSMIYEVLCFLFMVGATAYYIGVRRDGRPLNRRQLAIFTILFVCALNAKEMAVVTPAILAVYELLYYHGWRRRPSDLIPLALAFAISAAYTLGKMSGADSLAHIPTYEPAYTLDRFLLTLRTYAGQLLMRDEPPAAAAAISLWGILVALAAVFRRKAMWFGLAFAFLAFLPLSFVPPRLAFVLYIPMVGFGIYLGELIGAVVDLAAARFRTPPTYAVEAKAIVFVAGLTACAAIHSARAQQRIGETALAQQAHWKVLQEFARVHPKAKPGGRLLIIGTPLDGEWDLYFIAGPYINDRSLKVAWVKSPGETPHGEFRTDPDSIWRFDRNTLIQER
ncbi:MAG: hypothetical protein JSU00_21965 [Acidobacteria bacterium]|nr:hypothetical protein [Acidobacteriota bacterium]